MSQALLKIDVPAADQARVDAVFKVAEEMIGFVPDPIKMYSISPVLMELFANTIGYFRQHPNLSQPLLALIRYLGSERVGCQYCISLNENLLLKLGWDLETIHATRDDMESAPLEEKEKLLLRLALKALSDPDSVTSAEMDAARAQGWSERDIFDVVAMATNNRQLNLLLKTFKVEEQGTFA